MSIAALCTGQSVTVLMYVDKTDAAMGKGKTWKRGRVLDCGIFSQSSSTTGSSDLNMKDQVVYYKIYFASDPQLIQGQRLEWKGGRILVPEGLARNAGEQDRMWVLGATLHVLNNLNPDMVIT